MVQPRVFFLFPRIMCINYEMRARQHICAIHHTLRYPETTLLTLAGTSRAVFLMFEVSGEDGTTDHRTASPHLSNATALSRPSEWLKVRDLSWSLSQKDAGQSPADGPPHSHLLTDNHPG